MPKDLRHLAVVYSAASLHRDAAQLGIAVTGKDCLLPHSRCSDLMIRCFSPCCAENGLKSSNITAKTNRFRWGEIFSKPLSHFGRWDRSILRTVELRTV